MSIPGLQGILASSRVAGIGVIDGLAEYDADNVVSPETWPDVAGTPDNLTAAVGEQPTTVPNSANGKSGLNFDGIDDKFLLGTKLIPGPSFTSAHVLRLTSLSGISCVWSQYLGSNIEIALDIADGQITLVTEVGGFTIISPTLEVGQTHCIFLEYNAVGPLMRFWLDGVLISSTAPSPIGFIGDQFCIGKHPLEGLAPPVDFNGIQFFNKFWPGAILTNINAKQLYKTLLRDYAKVTVEYAESIFSNPPLTYEYTPDTVTFNTPPTVVEYAEASFNNTP